MTGEVPTTKPRAYTEYIKKTKYVVSGTRFSAWSRLTPSVALPCCPNETNTPTHKPPRQTAFTDLRREPLRTCCVFDCHVPSSPSAWPYTPSLGLPTSPSPVTNRRVVDGALHQLTNNYRRIPSSPKRWDPQPNRRQSVLSLAALRGSWDGAKSPHGTEFIIPHSSPYRFRRRGTTKTHTHNTLPKQHT